MLLYEDRVSAMGDVRLVVSLKSNDSRVSMKLRYERIQGSDCYTGVTCNFFEQRVWTTNTFPRRPGNVTSERKVIVGRIQHRTKVRMEL